MHIVILGGAGLMGSGTVRDLLSELSGGVTRLVIADTSRERMQQLHAALADPRAETVELDVTNAEQTMALLRGADLCINAVPTFAGFQMDIFGSQTVKNIRIFNGADTMPNTFNF